MNLRLKSPSEVRLFALAITLVAVVGCLVLQVLFYPLDLMWMLLFPSTAITICLALPISYFVGLRMLDIHKLTLQLEHAVNHDALTQTYSRVKFYDTVAQLDAWPMMLLAVDIDHFKQVNDRFGHQAGDQALKQFATTLIRNCREDDIVARFGGEEFLILLNAQTLEEGIATAERLCACIYERKFVLNAEVIRITASFGLAPVDAVDRIDDAVHLADLALYRAKASGRNRVCVYDVERDGVSLVAAAPVRVLDNDDRPPSLPMASAIAR